MLIRESFEKSLINYEWNPYLMRVGICVPTLNAGERWNEWIEKISDSDIDARLLIVDSCSDDKTAEVAKQAGFEVLCIQRTNFNHGGTRQLAVELLSDCEIIIFLTQDAYIASSHSLRNMLSAFKDNKIGAVCGRQLPHIDAGLFGSHARLFNYPGESNIRDISDISTRGIKAAFLSNSFAGYRRKALLEVGGFPANVIFGEDMVVAARMLLAGWKISYCADAIVCHSHDYSIWQEFKRYFDIGVFHARESWILKSFGKPEGEGRRFVFSELSYLIKRAPWRIFEMMVRTTLKYFGYKLGKTEARLPINVKKRLSMHAGYWNQ